MNLEENIAVFVRVMQGCNLNCDHCFTMGNRDRVMQTPMEYVDKFISAIANNAGAEYGTVYLHGGETFLAKMPYLHEVVALIRQKLGKTFKIIPQTNLTFKLTDEHIDFIKNHCDNHVGVSWDADIRFGSIKTEHAVRQEKMFFLNLQKLYAAGISVHISICMQKYLLMRDPIKTVQQFDGAKSIDFELLSVFGEKTKALQPSLLKWSDWYEKVVDYYKDNDTSWCLPQVDLFTRSIQIGEIYSCKCNCCDQRTYTLNPNGSVGFCPDNSYNAPVSHVDLMHSDWKAFKDVSHEQYITRLVSLNSEQCYTCPHYEVCGGNCEDYFFDGSGECPLSIKVLQKIKDDLPTFIRLLEVKAKPNLLELSK